MEFFSLKGKSAIVTGGAKGIGRAICERFAQSGANVCVADMDRAATEQAVKELTKHGVKAVGSAANIAVAADVQTMVKTCVDAFGALDILVNNAGIAGKAAPIWETDEAEFRKVTDINQIGLWLCCKYAVDQMRKQKKGRIVNIASVAGKEGNPRMMAYSASKAAVIGITKSLAKEVVGDGIIVNCITPAVIHTTILDQLTPEQVKYMTDRIPMGRTGKPEEVAALVHFLSSDDCSFSTGAVFDITGGRATY
jgi:3-oxoacyl-[acyl-carrier protein] reductase